MSVYGKKRNTYSARLFKTLPGAKPVKIGMFSTSLETQDDPGEKQTVKGALYGKCNVTACQKPNSALFYNKATMAFYCHKCALDISRFNPDTPELFPYLDVEMDAYFYAVRSGIDHNTIRELFEVPEGTHALF